MVGNYVYRQWASEELIFDKVLNKVSYYYNGSLLTTMDYTAPTQWQSYGMSYYFSCHDGVLATDNIRFGTSSPVPEPSALVALAVGLGALIPVVRRRK